MNKLKTWLSRIGLGLTIMVFVVLVGLLVFQQVSNGPMGPLMGGTFRSGEVIETPVEDWSELEGSFEFELVGQNSSRNAGGIVVAGDLYITCDLGFIWSRSPPGLRRNIAKLIFMLKTWHEEALLDGRIRIRKDGRIHSGTVERVKDPQLIEELKNSLEDMDYFKPEGLGPRPTREPNDIWFFRVRQS
ncbi:MAG: hypothetical protein GKR90_22710 [Pseudomonadales bacterium]|nr:hypothetical protein [Pseudomonadales bacterium]